MPGVGHAFLAARSLVLWTVSLVHFAVVGMLLAGLSLLVDPRRNDRPQRAFCRNILRLAGVTLEVRMAPGFDPARTSIFVGNHVNIFDPFVVCAAVPQFVRGFVRASHFGIPVYGWMMRRFGNVPVPDVPSRASLVTMTVRAREALSAGMSLAAFPEGSRTRDGRVRPFRKGIFSLALACGVPVVPMSIVGSYEFFRTGSWLLHPGQITVHLHDTIETAHLGRADVDALCRHAHDVAAAPVEEALGDRIGICGK